MPPPRRAGRIAKPHGARDGWFKPKRPGDRFGPLAVGAGVAVAWLPRQVMMHPKGCKEWRTESGSGCFTVPWRCLPHRRTASSPSGTSKSSTRRWPHRLSSSPAWLRAATSWCTRLRTTVSTAASPGCPVAGDGDRGHGLRSRPAAGDACGPAIRGPTGADALG